MAWKLFNPTVNRVTSGNQLDKPRFVNRSRVYGLQNTLANIIIEWSSVQLLVTPYGQIPLYGHLFDSGALLLRIVCFVPGLGK